MNYYSTGIAMLQILSSINNISYFSKKKHRLSSHMCHRFQNVLNSFPAVPLCISRTFLSSGYFFSVTPLSPSLSLCWGMPQRPSHLWVITFSRFRLDGWKRTSVFYRQVKSGMHVSFRDVCCRSIGHDLAIFRSQVGVLFFHQEPFLPNSAHQVSM